MKLAIAAILAIAACPAMSQNYIAIDPELKHQTVEGWGGSLSWWANRVGGWASNAQVDEICNWLTGPNELNMNVFRYNIGGGDSYGGTQRSQLYAIAKQYGKRLWQSESGPLWITPPDGDNSDLAYDLVIAARIVQDMHDMHANAWLDWQLMNSYTNTWGLLRYNDSAHTYVVTKNYYVRMQFSRFIKQGYTVIESNQTNTLAAINPANNQVVVVVVNATHSDAGYKLDMNLLAGVSAAQVYRTSGTENCASLGNMGFTNNQISYTAPAMSVTTFIVPVTVATSPIADGLYSIQAKHSSKYLSVQGWSADNGGQIEQWSWVNQSNLKFNIQKTSYGYKIIPSYNTKVFSVDASSGANGALLKQWSELNAPSQRYNIIDAGDGYYKIVAHNSAKCLAINANGMNNGDDLVQWEWLNLDNFKWKFTPVTGLFTNR